jgi:hypothetical protein
MGLDEDYNTLNSLERYMHSSSRGERELAGLLLQLLASTAGGAATGCTVDSLVLFVTPFLPHHNRPMIAAKTD